MTYSKISDGDIQVVDTEVKVDDELTTRINEEIVYRNGIKSFMNDCGDNDKFKVYDLNCESDIIMFMYNAAACGCMMEDHNDLALFNVITDTDSSQYLNILKGVKEIISSLCKAESLENPTYDIYNIHPDDDEDSKVKFYTSVAIAIGLYINRGMKVNLIVEKNRQISRFLTVIANVIAVDEDKIKELRDTHSKTSEDDK